MSLEPRVQFLNPASLVKIGGFVAAAAPAAPLPPTNPKAAAAAPLITNPLATGWYHCILAADTLFPEGSAQPFTPDEVAFISDVACALGKALDAGEAARRQDAAAAAAPAAVPVEGAEGAERAAAPAVIPAGLLAVDTLRKVLEEVYAGAATPQQLPEGGWKLQSGRTTAQHPGTRHGRQRCTVC